MKSKSPTRLKLENLIKRLIKEERSQPGEVVVLYDRHKGGQYAKLIKHRPDLNFKGNTFEY